jgi:hypothetical protein
MATTMTDLPGCSFAIRTEIFYPAKTKTPPFLLFDDDNNNNNGGSPRLVISNGDGDILPCKDNDPPPFQLFNDNNDEDDDGSPRLLISNCDGDILPHKDDVVDGGNPPRGTMTAGAKFPVGNAPCPIIPRTRTCRRLPSWTVWLRRCASSGLCSYCASSRRLTPWTASHGRTTSG